MIGENGNIGVVTVVETIDNEIVLLLVDGVREMIQLPLDKSG